MDEVKGSDRMLLLVLPLIAVVIGFWMLVLAPKSNEAGELQGQIDTLQTSIDSAEAEVATAELARDAFPKNYADLVSLGAAVPEQNDQATLIKNFSGLARKDSVNLRSFQVVPGLGGAPEAPAPVEPAPVDPAAPAPGDPAAVATTTAPATEADAATLPIGATVGPAGLPVTPYTLQYFGRFFDMAELFSDLDSTVEIDDEGGRAEIHGRLLTVDGFVLSEDPDRGFPSVAADLNVTTYLVPAEQGIAAGATPAGPPPLGSPEAAALAAATTPPAATTATVTP